jgi:hypothetical protein
MKYLKRFNESKNNLIELKSIGCSLDPIEGFLYPFLKPGQVTGTDNEYIPLNDYTDHEIDHLEGISEEDIKIIKTYYKSTEELAKQNIDWDLIKSIKDMSLGYLDKDYILNIVVNVKVSSYFLPFYNEFYSHSENTSSYNRYFPVTWNKLLDLNKDDNYYYIIRLLEPKNVGRFPGDNEIIYATDKETVKEFVNELRNTFPEYAEKLDYTKW